MKPEIPCIWLLLIACHLFHRVETKKRRLLTGHFLCIFFAVIFVAVIFFIYLFVYLLFM